MGTAQATRVRCPECGATLRVTEDAVIATCEYCGASSRVQRRTQIFQVPVRLPPAAPDEPNGVARELRTRTNKLTIAAIALGGVCVPLAVVGVLMAKRLGIITGSEGWNGHGPALIADLDGDGIDDVIGLTRYVQADHLHVAAFSGKDGHRLWESPSLGSFSNDAQSRLSLAPGLIVRTDERAAIQGFDLASGKPRWQVTAPEVVESTCVGQAAGAITIVTKDRRAWFLRLANGTLEPWAGFETCQPLPRDGIELSGARRDTRRDAYRIAIDGMRGDEILVRGDGPVVVLGHRQQGTSVPMVAAIDADDRLLWRAEVPGYEPLEVTSSVKYAAVSDHEIALLYERPHDARELVVFDRFTGARRFEVQLRKSFFDVLSGVAISRDAVFASKWGNLQAYDLATGKLRFTIGS